MFHRGDIKAAEEVVERTVPYEWALESLRSHVSEGGLPYALPYLPGRLGLVHRTAIADFDSAQVSPAEGEVALPEGRIVSDTGELIWEEPPVGGRVFIDAPCHQGIIMRAGQGLTSHMTVDLATPFAAIQLASLDGRPLAEANCMLLVTAARAANTGMKLNETRTALLDWGEEPTKIEPVIACLTLIGLANAKAVTVQPLDGCGQPLGIPAQATLTDDGFTTTLTGDPPTIWYEVRVQH